MSAHGIADIAVSILRWVADEPQPGLIEFNLVDSDGKDWRFIDKQAMASAVLLSAESTFPCHGSIRCEIVSFETNGSGRTLAQIDTQRPWCIESVDETHVFKVEAERLDRNVPRLDEIEAPFAFEVTVVTGTLKSR